MKAIFKDYRGQIAGEYSHPIFSRPEQITSFILEVKRRMLQTVLNSRKRNLKPNDQSTPWNRDQTVFMSSTIVHNGQIVCSLMVQPNGVDVLQNFSVMGGEIQKHPKNTFKIESR